MAIEYVVCGILAGGTIAYFSVFGFWKLWPQNRDSLPLFSNIAGGLCLLFCALCVLQLALQLTDS